MGTWSPALFADDTALDVRTDYISLLSVGKSDEEAERMILNEYNDIIDTGTGDESAFWLGLAQTQWKRGRLSDHVKAKALHFIDDGIDLNIWQRTSSEQNCKKRKKVLDDLRTLLISPMPERKKIQKASVRHCPWPVGSLLAYHIVSCTDKLEGSPVYGKYALLRVVSVDKTPVCRLAPTELYNESMGVALYGWIGDEIPSSDVTQGLQYIPLNDGPVKFSTPQGEEITFFNSTSLVSYLDWKPTRRGDPQPFIFLGCDDSYQKDLPPVFPNPLKIGSYDGIHSMDCGLIHILAPYLTK